MAPHVSLCKRIRNSRTRGAGQLGIINASTIKKELARAILLCASFVTRVKYNLILMRR